MPNINMRYWFKGRLELGCECEFETRGYEIISTATSNYIDYNIEPSITFGIGSYVTINAGYRFWNKLHNLNTVNDKSAQIEDFYSYGPVFTLDMFLVGGFLASLSNSYQQRRYPNFSSYDNSGLSLYSNRNINSLFFYLTWSFAKNWELNAMSMLDYDRDLNLDGGNTKSNLFNFELSYQF